MTMCQCQCQQSEVCNSCSASTIQASIITAIVTALLEAVFFVVLVAVCKCHPKFKSVRDGVSTGEKEQVYEEMGGDEGGVAVLGGEGVSDPYYMEGGGKTFQLKDNEAYGTRR